MHALGIDVGGTSIKAGRTDERGRVLEFEQVPTPSPTAEAFLNALTSIVITHSRREPVGVVGVGVPGLRSGETGTIEIAPNLPWINGLNVETTLTERTGIPTISRNDADLHAWGEFVVGAGPGASSLACLTLGTGVGSGLILDGRLYSGASGYGAEVGHIVVEREGLPCSCGSRGCLETVASAAGIVGLARRNMAAGASTELRQNTESLTSRSIHEAALRGDRVAREAFTEAGRYLGIACSILINLLNLEVIVVGGGVADAGELLLGPLRTEARSRSYPQTFEDCRIVSAKLGPRAGTIGAALFALSHLTASERPPSTRTGND